jgi:metallo-beta-lactamase family protein
LIENRRIPFIPVFVDSPLAIEIIKVYKRNINYLHPLAQKRYYGGDDFFNFKGLKMTPSVSESKKINSIPNPKIIIAGSGMSNGGRILYHEARYLSDPKSFLLIVGYQAAGSLGRLILEGARIVSIHNKSVPIYAKVKAIGGYSGHADQRQLLNWLSASKYTCKKVFVVQGEEKPASILAQKIKDELGIFAQVPEPMAQEVI